MPTPPRILQIVRTDPNAKYQTRALRGYIRIARQLQLPADAKLQMPHGDGSRQAE